MDKNKFDKIIRTGGFDNSLLPDSNKVMFMMRKFKTISKSEFDSMPASETLQVYSKDKILYFTNEAP